MKELKKIIKDLDNFQIKHEKKYGHINPRVERAISELEAETGFVIDIEK